MDLITDLDENIQEADGIQNFINNSSGVDKLWRLTDLTAPNFFTLRPIDKGKISLVDILPDFIQANNHLNIFDFSFCHLVKNVRKWKNPKNLDQLLDSNCLYLITEQIIQRARSDDSLREKISYIAITPGQEEKPLSHHWDLVYSAPEHDKDKDLIDLLMSCCELNPDFSVRTVEYINYIYALTLNQPQVQLQVTVSG